MILVSIVKKFSLLMEILVCMLLISLMFISLAIFMRHIIISLIIWIILFSILILSLHLHNCPLSLKFLSIIWIKILIIWIVALTIWAFTKVTTYYRRLTWCIWIFVEWIIVFGFLIWSFGAAICWWRTSRSEWTGIYIWKWIFIEALFLIGLIFILFQKYLRINFLKLLNYLLSMFQLH